MEIDYEAAWMALKASILEKRSHGQKDLLADMSRLEVENAVPAGLASVPPRPVNGSSTLPPRRVAASA